MKGGDKVENYVPISLVSKRYGKSEAQVRYAVKQGRLSAIKIGWQILFRNDELPEEWPVTPREKMKQKRGDKLERR